MRIALALLLTPLLLLYGCASTPRRAPAPPDGRGLIVVPAPLVLGKLHVLTQWHGLAFVGPAFGAVDLIAGRSRDENLRRLVADDGLKIDAELQRQLVEALSRLGREAAALNFDRPPSDRHWWKHGSPDPRSLPSAGGAWAILDVTIGDYGFAAVGDSFKLVPRMVVQVRLVDSATRRVLSEDRFGYNVEKEFPCHHVSGDSSEGWKSVAALTEDHVHAVAELRMGINQVASAIAQALFPPNSPPPDRNREMPSPHPRSSRTIP